jgi:hypothetical protein
VGTSPAFSTDFAIKNAVVIIKSETINPSAQNNVSFVSTKESVSAKNDGSISEESEMIPIRSE